MPQSGINQFTFTVGYFQIYFAYHQNMLKLKANLAHDFDKYHGIQLTKLTNSSHQLQINLEGILKNQRKSQQKVDSILVHQDQISLKLLNKLQKLQENMINIQQKLIQKNQKLKMIEDIRAKILKQKNNQILINSSSHQKLLQKQSLNDLLKIQNNPINDQIQLAQVLQQKLLEKQQQICLLQKKLIDRQELVQELADKLIVANVQKDDIFNQYQKILQTNVFHKIEQKENQSNQITNQTEIQNKNNDILTQIQQINQLKTQI